ncbi:MAG: OmpA family protein [Myxococcota bacterium]
MSAKLAVVGFVVLAAAGCTSNVVLKETVPVAVSADPPPPPPPPEPKRVEVEEERIRVDEKIHFEFDSAEIRAESHDLLDEIAQVMNDHPELRRIRVEGHTDPRGTEEYNLDLSRRRAESVVEYLVEEGGVDEDRLELEGYGFSRPIASNDTEEGMAKNRRVEFNILERAEDAPEEVAGAEEDAPEQAASAGDDGAEAPLADDEEADAAGADEPAADDEEAGAGDGNEPATDDDEEAGAGDGNEPAAAAPDEGGAR